MAPKKQKKTELKKDNASSEATNNLQTEVNVSDTQVLEPTVTTSESVKTGSRGQRSVCRMHKIIVKKARGKKSKVSFNEAGVPTGNARATLQSYIGMLARTKIPIDFASWPVVDPNLKEKLWLDVEDTFRVGPNNQDFVLQSAGIKWRQFKTALTKKFVLPFIGQKKKLSRPPKEYKFIEKSSWKNFVKQRTDPNWAVIHEMQSKRVKKRKYHHRLSRKGYIGLKEEEIKQGILKPGEDPDRAVYWKKARKQKNAEVDEELAKINQKIDDLLELKEKGELHCGKGEDVLTLALETPEHSGRVRAVGGYITPKAFFKLPREKKIRITKAELMERDRQRSEEMEKKHQDLTSEIEKLKAMIASGAHIQSPNLSDKASFQHEKDQPSPPELAKTINIKPPFAKELVLVGDDEDCVAVEAPRQPLEKEAPRQCELSVDIIDNKVAFGLCFPRDEDANPFNLLHGKPMPPRCLRVSVDDCIQPNALLPVAIPGEMEKVHEAVGSHVAWPEELISFRTTVNKKKELPRSKKQQGDMQKFRTLFSEAKPTAKVPKGFNLLYKHATCWMKSTGGSIQLPCDLELFGHEKTIFLLHENILSLLEFEMLGQAVISAYMLYLYTELRERGELENFTFVDPGSTFQLNDDFEVALIKRLKAAKNDGIFFLPYNHNMHWILAIIWDCDIYILNPLSHPTHFQALEKALTRVLKTFISETCEGSKVPKVKYLGGSPKQPGGIECGYVVMRYMKDIIKDKELTFATKWMTKSRRSYTYPQLDEVRIEALQFIQEHI